MEEFSKYEIEGAVSCIKNIMTRRELGQDQLAVMSGVSQSTISKVFSGESGASQQVMRKLCRALGVRLEDILDGARDLLHDLCGYLGTPLTGLTPQMDTELQRTVDSIKNVAHAFTNPKIELYWPGDFTHPLRNAQFTPQQVYLVDRSRASTHDFIVLFCGAPSYGVGQESEIATQAGLPAIRLIPNKVSRMISGSFLHAIDVPFTGSLETRVEFDPVQLRSALESIRPIYFKHRALYRNPGDSSFGKRLSRLIHERTGGNRSAATELGISLSYLNVLMEENLIVSNPSAQLLGRMAALFGTTVGYLLGEGEETDAVWVESKASWKRWIDSDPGIGASLANAILEEWAHDFRVGQNEQSVASYRKPVGPLTEADWKSRYERKKGKVAANASGKLF